MHSIALKKKFSSCLVLLTLLSCSSGEERHEIKDAPYHTSGVEQFFLTELPTWANVSESGSCVKSSSFQYLDFSKVAATYQLSYVEMLELQGQYNQRREDYFRSTAMKFLKPVEEASFFSNTLEQVRGGVRNFKLPQVPQVDIVWLEGFQSKGAIEELKKLTRTDGFTENLPLLFSSCLSKQRLTQWIAENNLEEVGFYLLSAEWLSPFAADAKPTTGLKIEIKKLLGAGVKTRVIAPKGVASPLELVL